ATVSGEAILPFFRASLGIENKGGPGTFDPVTAADRAAETARRTLIRESFPEHGIIGEEFGNERIEAEYCWVLDPIDGTKSFITGIAAWATPIAVTREGETVHGTRVGGRVIPHRREREPVYGMMDQPFTGELFTGDSNTARYRGPAGER